MPVQVASLFGLIDLKDSLTPGLEKAKGSLTSFSADLKSMGQQVTGFGVGLTAIGAPFLAFAAKAVQSASESEDALAQLDAVLKSTAGAAGMTRDELVHMSEALQSTSRFSDEAVLGAESLLLTFTNVGKTVFPRATRAIADLSTAMKQDLKSSAIQLGKALNDPVQGITALTRVGVTFTQSQKDMIQAMVDAGDVAGAQTIILAELEKEFGGSAEAAGKTFAGSLEILKNRFDGVLETLGTALIPVIQQFTGYIGQLIDWFEALDPSTQQTIAMIVALAGALAFIGPIIAGIGIAITALGGLLAGPLIPIALIIGAVILLAQHFGITFDQIKVYLSLLQLYAEYYFGNVVTAISNVINGLGDGPKGLIAAIAVVAGATGIGLLIAATGPLGILAAIGAAIALLGSQPGGFGGALATAGQAARDLMGILGVLLQKIKAVVDQLTGNVKTGAEGLSNIVQGLTSGQFGLGDIGKAVQAEVNGTPQGQTAGTNAAQSLLGSFTGQSNIKKFFGDNPNLVPIPGLAGGMDNVPYDNFPALLHEGERVLTKEENQGGGGDTYNLVINANDYDGGQAAGRGAMDAIRDKKRSRGG